MTHFEIELYRLINENFKGTAHKLTFPQILKAIGKEDAPLNEKSAIATLLHDEKFQRVLWQAGTFLWVGHDHKIRIIDGLAMKRLCQDMGKGMCRLCLMEEDDPRELLYNRDGESWVHPLCQHQFQKLQQMQEAKLNG